MLIKILLILIGFIFIGFYITNNSKIVSNNYITSIKKDKKNTIKQNQVINKIPNDVIQNNASPNIVPEEILSINKISKEYYSYHNIGLKHLDKKFLDDDVISYNYSQKNNIKTEYFNSLYITSIFFHGVKFILVNDNNWLNKNDVFDLDGNQIIPVCNYHGILMSSETVFTIHNPFGTKIYFCDCIDDECELNHNS